MKVELPQDVSEYVQRMGENNGLAASTVAVDLIRTAINAETRNAEITAKAAALVEEVAKQDGWNDEAALDDLVHDCASLTGSSVNNGGWEEQVRFILSEVGAQHGREQILAALNITPS
jgi:hypothetical protein